MTHSRLATGLKKLKFSSRFARRSTCDLQVNIFGLQKLRLAADLKKQKLCALRTNVGLRLASIYIYIYTYISGVLQNLLGA